MIRLTIIGWLEGSSRYLWATPVLLGPGQGITQQDVARSLLEVMRCLLQSDALTLLNTEYATGGASNPWKGTATPIITPYL